METIVTSIEQEMAVWANHPIATRKSKKDWLLQLQREANHIANGFIKKIIWALRRFMWVASDPACPG
ncbi:hypothetical protein ACSSZE_15295 [Acidithiobacillus caldus]